MNRCTNSFRLKNSLARLTFLIALLALPAYAQTRSGPDPYRNVPLKAAAPCTVGTVGDLRSLVKNGVELSVNEDWDCDGVADAYDNCVGLSNPGQIDSDRNRIGDACEAAATVRAGVPARSRSNKKAAVPEKSRANAKTNSRKPTVLAKNRANPKPKSRKPPAADRRSRPTSKPPRRR